MSQITVVLRMTAIAAVICVVTGTSMRTWALSPASPPEVGVKLSLQDAIAAALVKSYAMRLAAADQQVTRHQVRGAWSSLMPRVTATASYERTVLAPNPFAGSDAAELFSGADTGSWAVYNARVARGEVPLDQVEGCEAAILRDGQGQAVGVGELTFAEYSGCVFASQPPADPNANPFLVENTFRGGVAFEQLLYSASAFKALEGARAAQDVSRYTTDRTGQEVAGQVASRYYGAVLAEASVGVLTKSVARNRETVTEVQSRFREGVVPQFQLLSAEVELANVETELVIAKNNAAAAKDTLAFIIGLPVVTPITLTDGLVLPEVALSAPDDVGALMDQAATFRPDVRAATEQVRLLRTAESVTFARYIPELRLVANLAAVGTVPDDTSSLVAAPLAGQDDPLAQNKLFVFEEESRGIFDSAFWGTNLTVGVNASWTLFEGFARDAQLQQDRLETKKARIRLEELEQSVQQEVARERRNLVSALERLAVQNKNVDRARLNYDHAELRVKEGVSSPLELREASDQLDQSQLNRLQAIHDYLVAKVNFQVAIGDPSVVGQQEKTHD